MWLVVCIGQMKKGFTFESETDTESIVKFAQFIHDKHSESKPISFREVVERTVSQLVTESLYSMNDKFQCNITDLNACMYVYISMNVCMYLCIYIYFYVYFNICIYIAFINIDCVNMYCMYLGISMPVCL